eukprot:gi/632935679/ref/XP_007890887.1/ PREDICTED: probable G-protein coupled receptor 112 [Callorhinchus milii]
MVSCTPLRMYKQHWKSQWLLNLGVFILLQILQADTTSMKGQKAKFDVPSKYGTLHDGINIPMLDELTVCVNIHKTTQIRKWIAFTYYISQSEDKQELGIGGEDDKLIIWLSGIKYWTGITVQPNEWHIVCLTWSKSSSQVFVYLNGTSIFNLKISLGKVKPNGNLVLGQYQQQQQGSDIEFDKTWAFLGDLYYFRLWNFVVKSSELSMSKCTDGNVVNWQTDHWTFTSKTLVDDSTLPCASSVPVTTQTPFSSAGTSNGITSVVSHSVSTSQMTSPPNPPTSSTTEKTTTSSSLLTSTTTSKSIPPTTVTGPSLTNSPGTSPVLVHLFKTTMVIQVKSVGGGSFSFQEVLNLTTNWLKKINTNIVLLDLKLMNIAQRQNTGTGIIINADKIQRNSAFDSEYSCITALEVTSAEEESQIKQEIKDTLTNESYTDSTLTMSVDALNICVIRLVPGLCPEEFISTVKGNYTWPSTEPLKIVRLSCVIPTNYMAKRKCNLNYVTNLSEWADHDLDECKTIPGCILDLENVTINSTNADEYAIQMLALTNNTSDWSKEEIYIIVSKTSDVVEFGELSPTLTDNVIGIVDNLLNKANDLYDVSSEMLSTINILGDKFDFPDFQIDFVKGVFSTTMVNANSSHFNGMIFSIDSYCEDFTPMIYMDEIIIGEPDLFIVLPTSLQNSFQTESVSSTSRIQFQFYRKASLFQDRSLNNQRLNSYVVASSVAGTEIINLSDPVKIKLLHLHPISITESVTCVFWDYEQNNGVGAWNSTGCGVIYTDVNYTICGCNHLTHFGILLGISGTRIDPLNTKLLSFITYIGCGASSIFLGIVLLTYLIFEELRRDYPSKILLNLCTALLMLNMVFLVDSWIASYDSSSLCISVAVFLHYFLLTSFTWMGIEAVHMYFALVKVFNIYVRHYILKYCIIGWGVPAIAVVVVLSIDKDFYGKEYYGISTDPTDTFCWIQDITVFYTSVVTYFSIIFLVNLVMFIVVLNQIHTMKAKMHSRNRRNVFLHNVKSTGSLTILLGLTWGFAFFAWGPVKITFMYLFTIFNTLQGFFIFVFHCLMKENVRKQWRMHLCCGRFKLNENSEWSRTGTNAKLRHLGKSSLAHSNQSSKSNSTTSSSNVSNSEYILRMSNTYGKPSPSPKSLQPNLLRAPSLFDICSSDNGMCTFTTAGNSLPTQSWRISATSRPQSKLGIAGV